MAVVAMLMATVACSDDDEQTTNGTPTYDSGVLAVQELGTDTYRPLQLTNAVAYSDYLTSKGIDQYQWQTLLNGSLNAMMTRRVYWLDSLFHEQHGSPRLVFRHWHIESFCFSYMSKSVTGEMVRLSGRVTMPVLIGGVHEVSSLSLCINQHLVNQPTAPTAGLTPMAMRATFNSAVIEPDLEGYGVSANRFPCAIAYNVMASQALDCVKAALLVMKQHGVTLAKDGHTTLWGASLGAPIAAAMTRQYEENMTTEEKKSMNLSAVYCAEGPFNLDDIAYYWSQNELANAYMARHVAVCLMALPASDLRGHEAKEFFPEWMKNYQVSVGGKTLTYYDAIVQRPVALDQLFKLWPDAYPKEQLRYNLAADMTKEDGSLDFDNDKVQAMLDVLTKYSNWGEWMPVTDIYVTHCTDDDCVPYMQARDFYDAKRSSEHVFWKPVSTPVLNFGGYVHEKATLSALANMVIYEEPVQAKESYD